MGIDLQKGPPVPKQPLEPTTFLYIPWYQRDDTHRGGNQEFPSVVEIQFAPGTHPVSAGTRVFIVSKGPASAQVLVADSSPRVLGSAVGSAAVAIAERCLRAAGGVAGVVLPLHSVDATSFRVQLEEP
jgi:hypothetical protein